LIKRIVTILVAVIPIIGFTMVSTISGASAAVSPAVSCTHNPTAGSGQASRFLGEGVNIRTGPSTSCTSLGLGYEDQKVTLYCVNSSYTWVYLKDDATGVKGWVSASLAAWYGGAPAC
jgi:SH3-like domain-containing protein